jgi:hypothetical protein
MLSNVQASGVQITAGGTTIAMVMAGTGKAEGTANLMAAAPDLLKELKYLVDRFEEAVDYIPEYVAMADDAKAAIARAEGRGAT